MDDFPRLTSEMADEARKPPVERLLTPVTFLQITSDEATRAGRYDRPLALAMISIDGLAMIRKADGPDIAEEVLNGVITMIMELLRKPDRIGRIAMTELGVVMPETSLRNANAVAERLCQSSRAREFMTDAGPRMVTLSIGVAALSARMTDPKSLLMTGCFELRRARSRGKDRVCSAPADQALVSIQRSARIH